MTARKAIAISLALGSLAAIGIGVAYIWGAPAAGLVVGALVWLDLQRRPGKPPTAGGAER